MTDRAARLNTALEGRYRVERELGEGGMATVYLADDLRHERKVALKVLKPELAAVVGAERFLAEIKTTANLQHPHILPLYDSGEADGLLFYVMPFVEGETLRDRLDREHQLPVGDAVRIATNMAEALDFAHRHGVIHRDIKPANVLLQDGKPVISDFGIALAVGSLGGTRLTETGLSVGTPYYMSPEQATGDQMVGPATDTYALGAVLYEMLTGDPPYVASTAQAVLGKIIQGSPVRATEIRGSVPPNVDAAIRKALEKVPADRFTRAEDFTRALKDPGFRHGAEESSAVEVLRWKWIAGAVAAGALALAAVAAWALLRPSEEPDPMVQLPLTTVDDQIPNEFLALTPDGTAAVVTQIVGGTRLRPFLWRWTDNTRTMLPGVESAAAIFPFVSPDGEEVAYFDGSALRVVAVDGGVVRTLAGDAICCGRWGHDGHIYYSSADRNIVRVPEDGGAVEQVTPVGPEGTHGHFQILPGGDAGVFTVWSTPARLDAIRISTGERKTLTTGLQSYVTPTGHIVFATEGGDLLAARFDADALELVGRPVSVMEGVGVSNDRDAFYTLSADGSLLYWRTEPGARRSHFVWVTRSGEISRIDEEHSFTAGMPTPAWSLSPSGTRIAYHEGGAEAGEIWIKTLDRGPVTRLTFHAGNDVSPAWSPDGDTIFFASDRDGQGGRGIWARRSDGIGEATLILQIERPVVDVVRSPRGGWFVFRTGGSPNGDIFAQRPGIDDAPVPIAASPNFDEVSPSLSPDGRWIAYASDETGQPQVYVRPFPDVNEGRWQVSAGLGAAPRWSPDGQELLFGRPEAMLSATVETEPAFRVVDVRTLFEIDTGQELMGTPLTNKFYDLEPDGQRLLMARIGSSGTDGAAPQLILVQNFFEELDRRLPPP